jgi:hypothetical protein
MHFPAARGSGPVAADPGGAHEAGDWTQAAYFVAGGDGINANLLVALPAEPLRRL